MSGGGSSAPSTTTQTSEPPAFARPFLEHGLQQARGLYETGGPQYYGGNTVVPFAQQTEQALAGTEARATNGSPVNQAAQGYATRTLNGTPTSQFGAASNPQLDQTFNRAADAVQNRIQSGFAGSGRNIGAGRPVAAQEMNDLAGNIYGGAYESERNRMAEDLNQQQQRQFGLSSLAPSLANQDYVDLNALQGVGGQVEDLSGRLMQDQAARWDFSQNAPQINLDNYLSRIQGAFPGQSVTQTTPTYRNHAAGAAGGAMSGAALGTQVSPGWGTLIGAIGGGLLGGYG